MRPATPKPLSVADLSVRISWHSTLDSDQARAALDALAEVIPAVLREGHSVEVLGLGVFSRTTRKARRTKLGGKWVTLPETVGLRFTAAKAAKEKLR